MASIMHAIIGSNWGAIISHLQSNVSLNIKACADMTAFFSFWLLCVYFAFGVESPLDQNNTVTVFKTVSCYHGTPVQKTISALTLKW